MPITSWPARGTQLLRETTAEAPLTIAQREASLKAMLANTPFNSAAKLLKQFDLIAGPTGTRLVMYECKKAQYDAGADALDLQIVCDGSNSEKYIPKHQRSLRAYLEVLYFADAQTLREAKGRSVEMQIVLRGERVPPRNWTTFLQHWPR